MHNIVFNKSIEMSIAVTLRTLKIKAVNLHQHIQNNASKTLHNSIELLTYLQ